MKYKTFNEEMEVKLAEFGTGKLEIITTEEKATSADFRELEKRITSYTQENEEMLELSKHYENQSIII